MVACEYVAVRAEPALGRAVGCEADTIKTVHSSAAPYTIVFWQEDMEVMYPKLRLAEDNITVSVVGAHAAGTKYTGKFGYPCQSGDPLLMLPLLLLPQCC